MKFPVEVLVRNNPKICKKKGRSLRVIEEERLVVWKAICVFEAQTET